MVLKTFLLIWALFLALPLYASETRFLDQDVVVFVKPGDSYINLFGHDWLRVFQVNKNLLFYDKKGRLTSTPDKLVVGTKLLVPAGTHLTERALQRINEYENLKISALEVIQEAESFKNNAPSHPSEVYRQAEDLLFKAKEVARGAASDISHYVEARRMADEAIRCFKINEKIIEIKADLSKRDNDIRQLREQIKRERTSAYEWIELFCRRRFVLIGLTMIILLSSFFFWRNKKRKNRFIKAKAWMGQHENRLERLLRTGV